MLSKKKHPDVDFQHRLPRLSLSALSSTQLHIADTERFVHLVYVNEGRIIKDTSRYNTIQFSNRNSLQMTIKLDEHLSASVSTKPEHYIHHKGFILQQGRCITMHPFYISVLCLINWQVSINPV